MFTNKIYVTRNTIETIGRENWDKIRKILNANPAFGAFDGDSEYRYVVVSLTMKGVEFSWQIYRPSDCIEIGAKQILEFIKSKEPKMRKATDKVSITITLGELARAYAVMSKATGRSVGSFDENIFSQARLELDIDGDIYRRFEEKIENLSYHEYQEEWLKAIFKYETAEKIEKLQEIINNAQAELDALKKTL